MSEIKDFETFYTHKLQPFLIHLEKQGDEAVKWRIAAIVSSILAALCFLSGQMIPIIAFSVLAVFLIYKCIIKKNAFTDNYKEKIIRQILDYLNPGMVYKPNGYISSKDYRKSGLFRNIYDYYAGNDFIRGSYKNLRFSCSELVTDQVRKGRGSSRIFKGLFFTAPVSQSFGGGTYIWPKGAEQLAHSIMDEHYRLFPLPKVYRVRFPDPVFESEFAVYGTNPSEVRTIVDEELLKRLTSFKRQIQREIRFSVVAGICYVAFSINEELLEPSIASPGDKEAIKDYFFSLMLIFSIVNQLNPGRLI